MKITKEKLENIIKEEVANIIEQTPQTPRTSTGRAFPKNQEQLQRLTTQLNGILDSIPDGPDKKAYFKLQRQKNREMGYNEPFLNAMIKIASELAKKSKGNENANSVDTILQNVIQKFPNANKEAIKKIIELQVMLVKLKAAPAKLKNGKPFADGIFGRSTIGAIKNLYK